MPGIVSAELTTGRQVVDIPCMSDLKFAYAFAGQPTVSAAKAKSLAPEFQFERVPIKDVTGWTALRDLVWLDLGKVNAKKMPLAAFQKLAGLQPKASTPSLIFVSGQAQPADHQSMVEQIFSF